ncbi:MAG TPA: methylmalonyl-CoA epimerase [Thermotogota bacterium]|jgi:methylmalonyl-CoA/ethylmalonyl-CoA epimerase|nr:methylmalonyl-CoA epimerase [Thermotogota bacterium]NLH19338.1 methylmalonyl-CoA epimerase [Thermotogaceae bacterium]OQC32276.1 MAG: Glyoxalase/Bleomycin resistance protein/Dioxygenase superfamily protein [Thermotogota bacterium ADurb.Bin062]HNW46092.1 methylmalonyl-CoA epimerase [Thermotogota bacterium]HNY82969.1 methylmalonyl-CoA epimerase [Thermotogota bacterium]
MAISHIDHIGIAVSSLEKVKPFYEEGLGIRVEEVEELPQKHLKVAFIPVGDTRIELLEPTSEASTVHQFIQKRGEGIHHIAFHVDDIEASIAQLKEMGYRLLSEVPEEGAGGTKIVFLHPKSGFGVLIELVEGEGH